MRPAILNSRHAVLALERRRRQQQALGRMGTCSVCGRIYPKSHTNGWGMEHSAGVCSLTCHERQRATPAKTGAA